MLEPDGTLVAAFAAMIIGFDAEAKGKGSTGGGNAIVESPPPLTIEMLKQPPPQVVANDRIRLIDSGDLNGIYDAVKEIEVRIKAVKARIDKLWFRSLK